VGYGLNALEHRAELSTNPKLIGRTKWIMGFDPDPHAVQNLKKVKDIKIAESFEDLLDSSEIEGIIISSPPQFHSEQAIAALEAGLHVYSEVPMAINEKDLEKIIDAEEQSGKVYQLGENYCFLSEVLYAGNLSSSGKIGPAVYAESEYLHDVTYRWREGNKGDVETPRVESWYQLFDPLMYAHSIGPAQVALGGIKNPMPFVDAISFSNDIGGYEGKPMCHPAKAFQVGLFRTETESIAKCANAYIFAREPTRIIIQIIGRIGSYECYQIGKPGRLFLAEGHKINRRHHRKGESQIINKQKLSNVIPESNGLYFGALSRTLEDWLSAIEKKKPPSIHAKVAANFCMAGIAASKSARSGGKTVKIKVYNN
jgi:predicted dehydrogenase